MDLLQTVRKEGSRGGVNFSWDDVKNSNHRENYLGHSLMAPVGRWQQNKDLSWYAKAEDAELTPEQRAEKEREAKRAELRKVKQAEEDAMLRALGLPVPERMSDVNETPLGMDRTKQAEVNKALKEALGDSDQDENERGVGFGKSGASKGDDGKETLKGSRSKDGDRQNDRRRGRSDDDYRASKRRHRSRSRSRDRERDRDRAERKRHRHRRDRSRSPSRDSRRRRRSRDHRRSDDREQRRREDGERSRSRERDQRRRYIRSRSRSRSPRKERQHRRDSSR